MTRSKIFQIFLAVLFAIVLGAGLYKSMSAKLKETEKQESSAKLAEAVTVKVLTGSAKIDFLKDPKIAQILLENGILLDIQKSGSFETDLQKANSFDVVWPAAANIAQDFATAIKGSTQTPVFSTPLAFATWQKLIPVLQENHLLVKVSAEGATPVYEFDLEKALPLMLSGTRWSQLKGNTAFNVQKSFLVNTPDIRQSATASNYLAALAYVMNSREIPPLAKMGEFGEKLVPLIVKQGFQEGTLAGPFEDYLGTGMGKAPLVLIYESQFVQAKIAGKIIDNKHILVYPKPGIVLKHVVVSRTASGRKFAELLTQNKEIQEIAAQYGFRTTAAAVFNTQMQKIGLPVYELLDVAEMPTTAAMTELTKPTLNALTQ